MCDDNIDDRIDAYREGQDRMRERNLRQIINDELNRRAGDYE